MAIQETFKQTDFRLNPLPKEEYEQCIFENCDFSNGNLSNYVFSECVFKACNLSMCKVQHTSFKEVQFKECKMLGLGFNTSNPFLLSLSFENCLLNHTTFHKLGLKKTLFKNCSMQEVDFSESDLSLAVFAECDLLNATFDYSNLEKADLRSAYNFTIDPENNRLKKAKFSIQNIAGLLHKYDLLIE